MTSSFRTNRPAWLAPLALLTAAAWIAVLVWRSQVQVPPWPLKVFDPNLGRFWPPQAPIFWTHWLTFARDLVLLAAWFLGAHGLGRWLLERFAPGKRARLDAALYAVVLGFIPYLAVLFTLGAVGAFRTPLWPALFLGLTAAGVWLTWRGRQELRPARGWLLGRRPAPAEIVVLSSGLAVLLLGLFMTMAPELFFDSLVYHLAVPAAWLRAGGFIPLPHNYFSNFPMNVELLYLGALQLADERLCRLLHFALFFLGAGVVFSLGRRWFSRRTGLWGAALFATLPVAALNAMESGVDAGAVAPALLAVQAWAAWAFSGEGGERQPWLAGVLTGLALGAKYNMVFLLGPAVLVLAVAAWRSGRAPRQITLALAKFCGAALLLLAPWWIKNLLYTGNPVYPFLYQYFPSPLLDPEKMRQQMGEFREFGRRSWLQVLRLPWDLTFYYPTSNSYIGTNFLLLFPALAAAAAAWRKAAPAWRSLAFATALGLLAWSSQTQITRYAIPLLPLLAVLGLAALERGEPWVPGAVRLVRWGLAGFALWGTVNLYGLAALNWDAVGVGLGLESRDAYLDRMLMTAYTPTARFTRTLPKDARILSFGETRTFYFARPVTAATVFDRDPFISFLERGPDASGVWEAMRRGGYTHLFIHPEEAARTRGYEPYRWTPEARARLAELTARYLEPVFRSGQQCLYALRAVPRSDAPVKTGRPLYTYDREQVPRFVELAQTAAQAAAAQRLGDAADALKRLAALAPEWEYPHRTLAILYLQLGDDLAAFDAYRRADELAVLDAASYNNLGVGYLKVLRPEEARRYFRLALEQDPNLGEARRNLEALSRPAGR